MASAAFRGSGHNGTLHHYAPRLVAFEHAPASEPDKTAKKNYVVFIAGLNDGLLTVPYVTPLAAGLPKQWSLIEILMSSSYMGWGFSSMKRDADELNQLVKYLRAQPTTGKVVLLGHSTGCQDSMTYITDARAPTRYPIDAVVFQGSISDREAMLKLIKQEEYDRNVKLAREWVEAGRGGDALPSEYTKDTMGMCSADRFLSLASPDKDSDEDMFSSDLGEEKWKKTWGKLPAGIPTLILYSSHDQFVPFSIDKEKLVGTWSQIAKDAGVKIDEENSCVLKNATHNLEDSAPGAIPDLVRRVASFVSKVDGAAFK